MNTVVSVTIASLPAGIGRTLDHVLAAGVPEPHVIVAEVATAGREELTPGVVRTDAATARKAALALAGGHDLDLDFVEPGDCHLPMLCVCGYGRWTATRPSIWRCRHRRRPGRAARVRPMAN